MREQIANRNFGAADVLIQNLKQEHSTLDHTAEEAVVRKVMDRMQSLFDTARNQPLAQRIKVSEEILDLCADYPQALQFLAQTPPMPLGNMTVAVDNERRMARLHWDRSPERNVTYTLVRGPKGFMPTHVQDSHFVLLGHGLTANHWEDASLQEGAAYTYAVFCVRQGLVSEPVGCEVQLVGKIRNVRFVQAEGALHFTWDTPLNCTGTRIVRSQGGHREVVAAAAQDSFVDSKAKLGEEYVYTFEALYPGVVDYEGVSVVCKTTPKVDPFSISMQYLHGNFYRVQWPAMPNVALRIYVNGVEYKELRAVARYGDVELSSNSRLRVQVQGNRKGSGCPAAML